MAQNIYDDPTFFAGYRQLPRQVHGLEGAPEWPTLQAMFPDLGGKRVADLGCGFGWVSRWMRQQSARSVVGYDLSENMIGRARKDTTDPAIAYHVADLEHLTLGAETFDLVFSSLTFHYVRDLGRLFQTIASALVSGGQLIFSIEHPIFMAARHPHWLVDEDGNKTWPVDQYAKEGERRTTWFVEDVLKYHRRTSTIVNHLIGEGLVLQRMEEFAPSDQQLRSRPDLAEELERPMFLMISAAKP